MLGRLWRGIDDAAWRAGALLRLRNDPGAHLVPPRFRRDGKYLTGRNGRMFLAHDSARLLDQHGGRLTFTPSQLEAWERLLERRTSELGALGCEYLVLVVPNAHSVYPEDLPAHAHTAAERPVHRLLAHLSQHGSPARVLYPLTQLIERSRKQDVFPRTETHWNDLGAFVAYDVLANAISPDAPMLRLAEEDLWFLELSAAGDLGIKRRLPRKSPHLFVYRRHPTARLVDDNLVEGTGSSITTESAVAPPGTCVVFGDSYAFGLMLFLAESFRRVVHARTPALDMEVVERERPDVVVTVISERFLLAVPDDERAPAMEELASAKIAAGGVRERFDRWDAARHVAPAEVEWIRARMLADDRHDDAAIVSALAYSGLLPAELHRLRWRHVEPDMLYVTAKEGSRKVRMFASLAQDLAEWRETSAAAENRDLVFPSPDGGHWRPGAWRRWTEEQYTPLTSELGLDAIGPGGLRRTFVALSIHSGTTPERLIADLGEGPDDMPYYAKRVAHAARAGHVPAEAEIERARRLAARTLAAERA